MLIGAIAALILVVSIRTPQIFTAVTSVAIIMIYLAYLLVTAPMLIGRLRGRWPPPGSSSEGYFSLGRWGLPVNVLAVLWGSLMALNLAWPRSQVYGDEAGTCSGSPSCSSGPSPWRAGLAWDRLRGRHHLGVLPEHTAETLDGDPTAPRERS